MWDPREMINAAIWGLMRGIEITAEPINQHGCVLEGTRAIRKPGQGGGGGCRPFKSVSGAEDGDLEIEYVSVKD